MWKTAALIAGGACCLTLIALVVAGGVAFKAFGGFQSRGQDHDRGR